ncbi:MAG: hypothetical protein RJQ14_18640 [Marinoscillum sp.]
MISEPILKLAKSIEAKNLVPSINPERPRFIQPEDLIRFRATRIILICGMLNTVHGLSKEVISCVDFLLRNPAYQRKFILEYYKNQKNLSQKLKEYNPKQSIEMDFNIVRYKSIPWDLRFNDMFLYLYVRHLVEFKGKKPTLRVLLTDNGKDYYFQIKEVFIDEVNFLEIFGSFIKEDLATRIITEVIPNSYWKENEKLNY